LVWEWDSLLIERKISATHCAGKGSCRQAEIPFLHEAGMVTRLVSPLSLLFFLHRQKCCSLHKPSSVSHSLRCMMHQPNRSRCLLLYTPALVGQMPKEDRYRVRLIHIEVQLGLPECILFPPDNQDPAESYAG